MGLNDNGLNVSRRLASHFRECTVQRNGLHDMYIPSDVGSSSALCATRLNGRLRLAVRFQVTVRQGGFTIEVRVTVLICCMSEGVRRERLVVCLNLLAENLCP